MTSSEYTYHIQDAHPMLALFSYKDPKQDNESHTNNQVITTKVPKL